MMYHKLISEAYFLDKLNHTSEEYLHKIAKEASKIMLLNINLNQSKPNLVKTLYAVFYKVREELPENGILEPDGINTFSYDAHFSCPFSDNSEVKRFYMKLVDHFGFGKKFTRSEARSCLEEYAKQVGYPYPAKTLVYRIFQRIKVKHKKFATSFKDKKHVMLNEVKRWNGDIPEFD